MSCTDPIADMLTCVRNAQTARHEAVEVPHSRLKEEIARIMKREGFIEDYASDGGNDTKKVLRFYLKYDSKNQPVIRGIQKESKGGRRKYASADDLPRILDGLGIAIISSSSGVITDREAREKHVGGEVLCSLW